MLKSLQPWMGAKVTPQITCAHFPCVSVCPCVCMCNRVVKSPALLSDAGTFNHKKFFQACGLSAKSEAEVKSAFNTIDQDKSGFIEEDELK